MDVDELNLFIYAVEKTVEELDDWVRFDLSLADSLAGIRHYMDATNHMQRLKLVVQDLRYEHRRAVVLKQLAGGQQQQAEAAASREEFELVD